MTPVVKPGQVWESRDSRDLDKGPDGGPRRVRVIRVSNDRVYVANILTGKQTHIQLGVFASRHSRGGYRKVEEAPPRYAYRILDLDGRPLVTLTRSMLTAGCRIQRIGPSITDRWEDITDG